MQESLVQFLSYDVPLEKGEATHSIILGPPWDSDSKEPTCNEGVLGSIPGLGRAFGGGHGNLLQYSSLENPKDRGAWLATAHGVTKSWT